MLPSPLRDVDLEDKYRAAVSFVIDEVRRAGARGVVVGLSGGLDSSVAAKVCCDALGAGRVLGLVMPERGLTPKKDLEDATSYAGGLGLTVRRVEIGPVVRAFSSRLPRDRLSLGNLRARVRMAILYYYANMERRLVVGTGDRSEILLGYFTKWGDGGADLLPLGGMYKTELRLLATHLGVPPHIASKPSSPRLWRGQTAEGELGLPYETADSILVLLVDEGLAAEEVKERLGLDEEVERVVQRMASTAHKREMPHVCQ